MGKKPFTTRMDEEVLALAQRIAADERRSVTSLIEIAVLEYSARRGVSHSRQAGPRLSGEAAREPPAHATDGDRPSDTETPTARRRRARGGSGGPKRKLPAS